MEMPPIKGEVEFSHVVFSYEPGVRILNDVNFKANIGDSFCNRRSDRSRKINNCKSYQPLLQY